MGKVLWMTCHEPVRKDVGGGGGVGKYGASWSVVEKGSIAREGTPLAEDPCEATGVKDDSF